MSQSILFFNPLFAPPKNSVRQWSSVPMHADNVTRNYLHRFGNAFLISRRRLLYGKKKRVVTRKKMYVRHGTIT